MTDAIARAAGVPGADVRRAHQLSGSLPTAAAAALGAGGDPGCRQPPRCGPSRSRSAARSGRCSPRQRRRWPRHWTGSRQPRWSGRSTASGCRCTAPPRASGSSPGRWTTSPTGYPRSRRAAMSLAVSDAVLDGEAVALRPDGRPHPFQVTSARAASQAGPGGEAGQVPLSLFLFDALHLDGTDLIDAPAQRAVRPAGRGGAGRAGHPEAGHGRAQPRPSSSSPTPSSAATRASWSSRSTLPTAPAAAAASGSRSSRGTRSTCWSSAAEWGHGRRQGWLSNLHLGARDPATGRPVMLGKTFKGLTDALLAWQTERLLELADPPRTATPTGRGAASCGSGPSSWSRSPSTGSRRAPGIRAASRSDSPECCGTGRTRTRRKRTRSMRCAPCGPATSWTANDPG